MDANAILTAIGTVGFPIVACAALFWQNWKMSENHRSEMAKITEAVNNNTNAIAQLTEKLKEGKTV